MAAIYRVIVMRCMGMFDQYVIIFIPFSIEVVFNGLYVDNF